MSDRISKDDYFLEIALTVSKRSTCLRRHYGCVIVNNNEIIATGYNGSARGEVNCVERGSCPRMYAPHNSGDYSTCCSVHAEQNAMLTAARRDMIGATMYLAGEERILRDNVDGYEKWVGIKDCSPCPICVRMIANSGVERVVNHEGIVWERS